MTDKAVIADDAAKARLKIEGRQLYSPPINPRHRPLPPVFPRVEWNGAPATMVQLTDEQKAEVFAMFAEGDERRARALNVEELERSIALVKRCGMRVPNWMFMGLKILRDERHAKYGLGRTPEA